MLNKLLSISLIVVVVLSACDKDGFLPNGKEKSITIRVTPGASDSSCATFCGHIIWTDEPRTDLFFLDGGIPDEIRDTDMFWNKEFIADIRIDKDTCTCFDKRADPPPGQRYATSSLRKATILKVHELVE